jgi:hypothetical protein
MRLQITVPHHVPLAVIEAALRELGASIVQKRAPLEPKPEKEYRPVIFTRTLADGTQETDEIDGVTVDKAIRKLMSEVNARARHDGRTKAQFERLPVQLGTAEYVEAFCARLHHVPAAYTTDQE